MVRYQLDLGVARDKESLFIQNWRYMYVGDCDGDVELQFDNSGWIDPNEFDKIGEISGYNYLYFKNEAQDGKTLVLYYDEKFKPWWQFW